MEVTIVSHRDSSLSFVELKRDRTEVKKNVKFSKRSAKEMMTVTKAEEFVLQENQTWRRKEACSSKIRWEGTLL